MKQPQSQRDREDILLAGLIKHHWLASGGMSGYCNIHLDLLETGAKCGRDRVLRLMQLANIEAIRGYKSPTLTYSGTDW